MNPRLRTLFAGIVVLAVVLLPRMAAAQNLAQVRVIHLSPDGAPVDVYIGDTTSPVITGLSYESASSIHSFQADTFRVIVTGAGSAAARLIDKDVILRAGQRTDIALVNPNASLDASTFSYDYTSSPDPDSAYVRIVHASPDQGNVDVTVVDRNGNAFTVPNLTFPSRSAFLPIPAGAVEVLVHEAGTPNLIYHTRTSIAGGNRVSIITTGFSAALQLRALYETNMQAQQPMQLLDQLAEIRVVHLMPDAPPVDVYIDNLLRFSGLTFNDASAAVQVATGAHHIEVTRVGNRSSAYLDRNVSVTGNTRLNFLATGTAAAPSMTTTTFGLSMVPSGDTAYVRFVHASPNAGNVDLHIVDPTGDTTVLGNVAVNGSSSWLPLPAGDMTIDVYKAGTRTLLEHTQPSLVGGLYATVFTTEFVSGLSMRLLVENDTNAQQPMVLIPSVRVGLNPHVRVVQAIPDAPPVDIFADTALLANRMAFRDASNEISIDPGTYQMGVAIAGAGGNVISQPLTIGRDTAYTAVSIGSVASAAADVVILKRPLALRAPTDSLLVRGFHAAPGTGPIDVMVIDSGNDTTRLQGMAFGSWTGFNTIAAGPVRVEVAPAGGEPSYTAGGTLPSGSVLTMLATGTLDSNDFRIDVLVESDSSAQRPMLELQPILPPQHRGQLRVVHVSPDVGNLDVYIAGDTAHPIPLSFRYAGPTVSLPAPDRVGLRLSLAGNGFDTPLESDSVDLAADTLGTAFALGSQSIDSLFLLILPTDLNASIPAGQTMFRLLDAAPDTGAVDVHVTYSDGSDIVYRGMHFTAFEQYAMVPAGATSVEITPAGGTAPILTVAGTVPPDAAVTMILTGQMADHSLGVNLLVESDTMAQEPMLLFGAVQSVTTTSTLESGLTVAPNPATTTVRFRFTTSVAGDVAIDLYDVTGRRVASVPAGTQPAGTHEVSVPTSMLASGTYSAVLTRSGRRIATRRLVVQR